MEDIDVAKLYHENTKIAGFEVGVEEELSPIEFGSVRSRFRLPQIDLGSGLSLAEAILSRRSCRDFDPTLRLSIGILSRLLMLSCGYTARSNAADGYGAEYYRAMPSAGATYPIEVFPLIFRVSNLEPGAYRYAVNDHSLELIRPGSFHESLGDWAIDQPYLANASLAFILAGLTDRISPGFGERGYRYVLMEAGHIAQNICLLCSASGLGSLTVGAFVDDALNGLLGLNGDSQVSLYVVAVGPDNRQ